MPNEQRLALKYSLRKYTLHIVTKSHVFSPVGKCRPLVQAKNEFKEAQIE
jgi:hypothetical protein